MSKWTKRFIAFGAVLVLVAAFIFATASTTPRAALAQTAATATPTKAPTPTLGVPFFEQWAKSPHNDATSLAFTDWDETENKMVPAACAQCHSTPGYLDYLGVDKSAAGKVDKDHPIGTTVQCVACHNSATDNLDTVQFLSTELDEEGKEVPVTLTGLGPEARCMVCHQGRATKTQVDARVAQLKAEENPDAVPAPVKNAQGQDVRLGFINIHYYAAAVTLYGSQVHGGYEYDGKSYDVKNDHVPEYDSCVECHDSHTTDVKVAECAQCHEGKTTVDSLRTIRMLSSQVDYDGDGNIREGMDAEIKGMQQALLKGIQSYAKDVVKTGIVYDATAYPYFFEDKDNDGKIDKNDKNANVSYSQWTPRMLKAAYNYQVSLKDPGAYAHGNKYIVQLLYDSMEDLNAKLATKIDMAKMARDDAGHFAGNTLAFRDWDADGEVPANCARCHSAEGLPQFIKYGAVVGQHPSNGFQCTTCHQEGVEYATTSLLSVKTVPFPSGAQLGFNEGDPANLCLECHQGRESTVSVNRAIGQTTDDTVDDKLTFRNVHYFAAGATLFGSEAQGAYQYKDKEYVGRFMHVENADTCIECHDAHVLKVNEQNCAGCHKGQTLETIRMASVEDYDGDGDVKEGLAGEIATLQDTLYKALQSYAKDTNKVGIIYDAHAYPYFFADKDNNNQVDKDEKGASMRYTSWSPRLLRGAYNFQYSQKDPGGFAHNGLYIIQALYDSIEDLNGKLTTKIDMSKMVRPEGEQ